MKREKIEMYSKSFILALLIKICFNDDFNFNFYKNINVLDTL